MTETTTNRGLCQVRSRTGSPCLRHAEVEILGVAFCGACARQQEAYFVIGELTQGEEGLHGTTLVEALESMWRERAGGTDLSLDADTVLWA